MLKKLKCAVIDDDPCALDTIKGFMASSAVAEVNYSFTNPQEFLDSFKKLDIDVCLVDIVMPEINGFELALRIGNKPVIFISGHENKLIDAFRLVAPIDVVPKPTKKERLFRALEKAHKIIHAEKDLAPVSGFFSTHGQFKQVKLKQSEIVYVKTDDEDRRHKLVILRNGKKHKIMNCTLEKILSFAPNLIRINKAELISTYVVNSLTGGNITLEGITEGGKPKRVTLSRTYMQDFKNRTGLHL